MKIKNAFLSLSAISMIVMPVAAQAGTKASASVGKLATSDNGASDQSAEKKKKRRAGVWIAVAAAAAAGATAAAVSSGNDNKSRGS